MGTPEFAVHILDELIQQNYNVVGVITAPDRPAGRGQKVKQSAVKIYAQNHKLNILQPENLKHFNFIKTLKALNPDLQVVVAFRMLPQAVWQLHKNMALLIFMRLCCHNTEVQHPSIGPLLMEKKKQELVHFLLMKKLIQVL